MRSAWKPALLIIGLIAAGAAVRLLPGGAGGMLDRIGAQGRIAFVVGVALLSALGLPRGVTAYAGGFAFGVWEGIALATLGQLAGSAASFAWARLLGRDWARAVTARRLGGRLARLDAFLSANPFSATLMIRLMPVGSNLVFNLLGGVCGIAILPFLAASAIGFLPQTAVFALIGAGTRVDRASQVALGIALFFGSAALGVVLLRRFRGGREPAATASVSPVH